MKKYVYILLTDTGTWFTRMIRFYTGARHNHASIGLDCGLNNVYSFGRKKPSNPWTAGFVQEDLRNRLFGTATCAVYRLEVDVPTYDRIIAHIDEMDRQRDRFKYNLIGLFAVAVGVQFERSNAYFCSQFVASVLTQVGVRIVDKPPGLVTPEDLAKSELVTLVYQGSLRDYLDLQGSHAPSGSMAGASAVHAIG